MDYTRMDVARGGSEWTAYLIKTLVEQRHGVGAVAAEALRRSLTNDEVLRVVRTAFPEARTTMESIATYRSRLRSAGEPVPGALEAEHMRTALGFAAE